MAGTMLIRGAVCAGVLAVVCAPCLAQNQPPLAPTITEPQVGRIVNPGDVHMETDPFVDPNPGDTHRCTDWEIWSLSPVERVWVTSCIGGIERLHTHLGDGVFENSLAGRRALLPERVYELRVRFRDSSNTPASEWSAYGVRQFTTGTLSQVFPMEVQDVLVVPGPTFVRASDSGPIVLGQGSPAPSVTVEAFGVGSALVFSGSTGGTVVSNPPSLSDHGDVRVVVSAGSVGVDLPEANIAFTEDDGSGLEIFLPAISLGAGQSRLFWVSSNGSTYEFMSGQAEPDFSMLARGAPVPWTTASDFRAEIVASGFQLPVNIDFVPSPGAGPDAPLYYVAELYGGIKVVRRGGVVSDYATGLLNYNPTGNFPGSGEQGLGDIAVDPTNGDIYVTLLYSAVPGVEAAPHYPAVERLTSTDGGLTMATRTRILSMAPEQQGQSHQISNISFGPDGNLYVHVGDGFDAGAAQNLTQFRGKILRMTRAGQPVATNPFYNAADGITARDYVFASGVRNPFGGAWRASDQRHFIVENGPSVDRMSALFAGTNYGYDGSDGSMFNFALYNWVPSTAPVNMAFLQGATFGRSGFPAAYEDRAYITLSGGTFGFGPGNANSKSVVEFVFPAVTDINALPAIASIRAVAIYNGSGPGSAVAMAAGPDGLYFSDFYAENSDFNPVARGANILRLRYIQPPPPPDCNNNGVPDAEEIASGAAQDCNLNSIPDGCDIASGRSSDCNGNTAPDECEGLVATVANFDNGQASPFGLNGVAAIVNGAARLTTSAGGQFGSIVSAGASAGAVYRFQAAFDFRIGNGSGADGMSFAVMDAGLYPGTTLFGEEGPGVQALPGGEPEHNPSRALTIQFDTYDNGGEGENTIELMYNNTTIARHTPSFEMEDFVWRRADVAFNNGRISVGVTPPGGARETVFANVEVPGYVPVVSRYGFGGRTGGLTNEHWVDNVSISLAGPLDANQNGRPDICDCRGDANGNGRVTFTDITTVLANFGTTYPFGVAGAGDCDFDREVSFTDVTTVLANFGNICF